MKLLLTLVCCATLLLGCVDSNPAGVGMAVGDQAEDADLWALVPGNDLTADRINLVFASWGRDDHAEFVNLVSGAISWEGDAYLIEDDGRITTDRAVAVDAKLGLFGIEPWRSLRDRFNVWYTDREPETPVAWLNNELEPFPVADAAVVVVARDAYRFNPDLSYVSGQDVAFYSPEPPQRPAVGNPLANSVIVVDSSYLAGGLIFILHELGHVLFAVPDVYVGDVFGFDGRTDLSSWPSCAEGPAEAGFPLADAAEWAQQVRVGFVDRGCYGVSGSTRATQDSLMNSSIPVLGSVNR